MCVLNLFDLLPSVAVLHDCMLCLRFEKYFIDLKMYDLNIFFLAKGCMYSSAILDLINMYFHSSMTIIISENGRKSKIEAYNC